MLRDTHRLSLVIRRSELAGRLTTSQRRETSSPDTDETRPPGGQGGDGCRQQREASRLVFVIPDTAGEFFHTARKHSNTESFL